MGRTGHLGVWQGKRVKVYLHKGETFVAKFKERRRNSVEFYDHPSEATTNIRTLTIYKGEPRPSPELGEKKGGDLG